MKQLRNMPRKKVSIPVVESKPKVKYVSPIKDYSVSYDAVIKIRQTSLQPIIPAKIRTDKRNFVGKLPKEVLNQLSKIISETIKSSCSFCTEVVSVDRLHRFPQINDLFYYRGFSFRPSCRTNIY